MEVVEEGQKMNINKEYEKALTKEFLFQKYTVEEKTTKEIGKEIGCCDMTVSRYLRLFGISLRKPGKAEDNLVGETFDRLFVEEKLGRVSPKSRICRYRCTCKCGNEAIVGSTHLRKKAVRSCGCLKNEKGKCCKTWTGGKYLSGTFWAKLQHSARSRGISIDLNIEQAEQLLESQGFRCKLTNRSLIEPAGQFVGSIDRIENDGPYTIDNIQWVDKDVNRMKWKHSQEYFVQTCKEVASLALSQSL